MILDVRVTPQLTRRFTIIDARTGLKPRWFATIWVDDHNHRLGVKLMDDILQGNHRITEVHAPKIVIDMARFTILIHVGDFVSTPVKAEGAHA